jgi:hypothetical protein
MALSIAFATSCQYGSADRNFLGRSGWLDRLRIGIIDYDHLLYLSTYDS